MRRHFTPFLFAAFLAAATWACDEQAPTSPTPVAALTAGPLATSIPSLASSAPTSPGSVDVRSAKGGKPGKPDKPKPPPDDEPPAGETGVYMATISFGGLTATTEQITLNVSETDIHVALTGEFDISTVADVSNCFTDYAETEDEHYPFFHVFGSNPNSAEISVRFGASTGGGKAKGYGLDLTGALQGDWLPAAGATTTANGSQWSVEKVQGKGAGECATGSLNWSVTVLRP